jgi:catechol 2,3-dioxygenase-like lactoylglutathione lyase family enzyme
MAVRDAEAAYEFLHDVFGAEKVEEEFARFLDGPFARVIHVGLGDVVLQFVEPRTEEGSWFEQLESTGPGVHNLTFVVDDIRETVAALDNVKPDPQPVYMVGSREKIGFHLELAESPLREPPEPAGPREIVGDVSPLLHVEIVVRDVEESCRFLHEVFGAEQTERAFASFLDSPFMKIRHVLLGDVVLQLCQPLVARACTTSPSWSTTYRPRPRRCSERAPRRCSPSPSSGVGSWARRTSVTTCPPCT